ncbi:hypothetical protein SCHPADRAFT_854963 [Schizopora paradoxa]|uniref:Uncharacterized protein n=1 Tax=Schizopora paradoxa TaxID=27342 RepID=A0A0H2RQ86_9AGAM|nr:hypothetical protein SCHPADRAFT_854963 [Schizopora paradoxa]
MSNIVLGPGPEIPPLTAFVQLGLTAVYEASSLDDFNSAFDSVFAQSLKDITFNGQKLSRDEYKTKIRSQQPLATPASSVTFGGTVTDSTDNNTGNVGAFYNATFLVPLVIGAPPSKQVLQSSLNILVKEDKSLGGVDPRRVFSVDQVAVEQASN